MPNFFDQFDAPVQNSGMVQLPASPPKPPGGFAPPAMNRPVVPTTGGPNDPTYIAAAAAAAAGGKIPTDKEMSSYNAGMDVWKYGQQKKIDAATPQGQATTAKDQAQAQKDQAGLALQSQGRMQLLDQEYNLAKLAAQADDRAKAGNGALGNTATGGWNQFVTSLPFTGSANASVLNDQLDKLRGGMSALGSQTMKQIGGAGVQVRALPEFYAMGASSGPLKGSTDFETLHSNLITAQNLLRNHMALQLGLDPTKTDVTKIPGGAFEPSPRGRAMLQSYLSSQGITLPPGGPVAVAKPAPDTSGFTVIGRVK